MIWNICLIISIVILSVAVIYAVYALSKSRYVGGLTPFYALFAGVFLAVFIGMIPMFAVMLHGEKGFLLKLGMFDFLQTLQVFTINVGADLILDNINKSATAISNVYSTYMTCLFFVAPILTFGFLISLFKNAVAGIAFRLHYRKDVYAFSELNEKSLILAKSIKNKFRNALLVFANVDNEEDAEISELIESAKELKAIVFRKDILSVDFKKHSKESEVSLFAIGENESENTIQALKLIDKYNQRKNTGLYVFSSGTEGEMLLANARGGELKIRRVNEIRALIYRFLYDEGYKLFESAVQSEDGKKAITAVIAGLGKYGTEMLKALSWYCQMDGYTVEIHAFDRDELAEDKFAALCPELMSEKYNGVSIPGESEYTIQIHSGTDVRTKTFSEKMNEIGNVSFVFVCLGDDTDNINQAANIRMLCERMGSNPVITTVVYSSEEKEAIEDITNYRGQPYGIKAIGDLESSYSEEILVGSELEKLALERHLKWGKEDEFWQYEYNYRSSMASAIHLKARIACGIPGADKAESDLNPEERDIIEHLEHRRWNTYMRSEGYVYSGSPEKSSRNDLAKMHHDLVDFDSLTEEDKRKDSRVGTEG